MAKPKMCELCTREKGTYSQTRKMYICQDCWQALGRMNRQWDRAFGQDLTGQDEEVRNG